MTAPPTKAPGHVGREAYLVTYAAQGLTLLLGLSTYYVAGRLDGDAFSHYALGRRMSSFMVALLLLGCGNAVTRLTAWETEPPGERRAGSVRFLAAGLLVVLVTGGVAAGAALFLPRTVASLAMGDPELGPIAGAAALAAVATCAHTLAYSYVRGRTWFRGVAVLQVFGTGLVPVLPLLLGVEDVATIFRMIAVGYCVTSIPVASSALIRARVRWSMATQAIRPLLSYGLRRVPGDAALAAIFSLPAFIVSNAIGPEDGGYVAVGSSLVVLAGTAFAPLSVILLPQASRLFASGDTATVRHVTRRGIGLATLFTLVGNLVFLFTADFLVPAYLGPGHEDAIWIMRVVSLGAVPYASYVVVRSAIDAATHKAINTRNAAIAAAAGTCWSLGAAWVWGETLFVCAGLPISMLVIATLSVVSLREVLHDLELENSDTAQRPESSGDEGRAGMV